MLHTVDVQFHNVKFTLEQAELLMDEIRDFISSTHPELVDSLDIAICDAPE
jgi:hypothetical protein